MAATHGGLGCVELVVAKMPRQSPPDTVHFDVGKKSAKSDQASDMARELLTSRFHAEIPEGGSDPFDLRRHIGFGPALTRVAVEVRNDPELLACLLAEQAYISQVLLTWCEDIIKQAGGTVVQGQLLQRLCLLLAAERYL